MSWEVKKLSECCIIAAGQGAPQGEMHYLSNEGIPFIKAAHLKDLLDGADEYSLPKVNQSTAEQYRLKLYPKGTVIFAKSGMSTLKGRIHILENPCYVVNHLACIIPENINGNYLKYWFILNPPNRLIKDEAYPSISLTDIGNLMINIPEAKVQEQIAIALDKSKVLIEKRKEQISILEKLGSDTFYDMFGDPAVNHMGWDIKTVGDTIKLIEAGWSVGGEQREREKDEIAVLKVSAVTQGFFKDDEYKVIDKKVQIKKHVFPRTGDLLFSRANTKELVGATCLIVKDYPNLLLPDKLWRLEFNNNANCVYMKYILSNKHIRDVISDLATGTSGSMYNISMEKLKSIEIPIPDIELQNEFAKRILAIEEQKSRLKSSFTELETTYRSIMQKAFSGELFN